MMLRMSVYCLLINATFTTCALAAVDESPMPVKVVSAFPQLDWPDWLRGLDVGKPRDPRPLLIIGAHDGTNRIFAASEYGTIHVWPNDRGAKSMKTFLDIRDRVQYDDRQNEEGFLGVAFHPRYRENGEFFVYYTAKPTSENPHLSIISRFHVSRDDPNRADPNSEEIIMRIQEPYWNHNGGTLVFGLDGYLYIGLGDGGLANDPHGNGQKMTTLLGKILRIDVDHKDPGLQYAIPKDNPFAGRGPQARGEIWCSAYATSGECRLTVPRGFCGLATWGKTRGRKSISFAVAATMAGIFARPCIRLARTAARHGRISLSRFGNILTALANRSSEEVCTAANPFPS